MRDQGVSIQSNRKCDQYFASLAIGLALVVASCALHAQVAQGAVTVQGKYDVATLSPVAKTPPNNQPELNVVDRPLTSSDAATYAYALQLYDNKRYSAAYGRFARLADTGHAASAQKALFMLSNLPAAPNGNWSATVNQQDRWARLTGAKVESSLSVATSQTGD